MRLSNIVNGPRLTAAGLLAIAAGLAHIWLPPDVAAKVQASVLLVGGLGLTVSADPGGKQ